ncbi:MAG: M3 family oligoendopeptidase [Candidatus Pacearchaeota archaeon]
MLRFKQQRWDLNELVLGRVEDFFEKVELKVREFENFRGLLKPNMDAKIFLKILKENERIAEMLARLSGYASLLFYSNVYDQKAIKLKRQVEQFSADIENRMLFFSLFWKRLEEKDAKRILEKAENYRYFLKNLRKFRKYTLNESEEKILNLKDIASNFILKTLYTMIVNRFLFELELKGKKKYFTRDQLVKFIHDANKNVRRKAYAAFFLPFKNNKEIIAEIYKAIALDWKNENIKLRGFKDAIAVRNLLNDVPDEAVEKLFSVCKENVEIFQKYFSLKARFVGMKRLTRYDLYAPVGKARRMGYSEAMQLVIRVFKEFCPEFYNSAIKLIKSNHVDSETRRGKVSNAFNFSVVPELLPYVLLNPSKTFYDALTIAHEFGHAIHSILSSKNSFFNFHPSLPLAEVASVFSETLVYESLFEREKGEFKKNLMFDRLDSLYATIQRQAFFSIFEKEVYENIENLSMEEIALLYEKNLKEQFGSAISMLEDFKWEWLTVSHFYESPFYCYSYAFANLVVLSLYERYKEEGKDFLPCYLDLLRAGNSEEPEKLLLRYGFDICSKNFWQEGFKFVEKLIKEAENVD